MGNKNRHDYYARPGSESVEETKKDQVRYDAFPAQSSNRIRKS